MKAVERLSPHVIGSLKAAIDDAFGNEVFAVGCLDRHAKVAEIKIVARGDVNSVPALDPYIEKGDVVIHNHPSGRLSPSSPDLSIASRLGNNGIGFYIIDNNAENVYVVAEAVTLKEQTPLDETILVKTLSPGGALEKFSGFYEERPTQIGMLKFLCTGLNQDEICIAEAGTGVGKSLAYLVPAVKWIAQNNERIVVSTATINLQQQLMEQDIPLVKKMLGLDIKAVLVKGRGNYICQSRLAEAMSEYSVFDESTDELKNIRQWSLTSDSGSKSDLSFFPSPEIWSRVCSETDLCFGLHCRYRETCFVLRAKREAASAGLLVANHHLLFSDLAMRLAGTGHETTAVLPPFQRIIFDEAHNIEASATSFFSRGFNRFLIFKYLNRFYREKKGNSFGLLLGVRKKKKNRAAVEKIKSLIGAVREQAALLDYNCLFLFGSESSIYLKKAEQASLGKYLFEPMFELQARILTLCHSLDELIASLADSGETESGTDSGAGSLLFEMSAQVRRLKEIAGIGEAFRHMEGNGNEIFWLDRRKTGTGEAFVRFIITPLDISKLMKEAVYEPYPSVVFTSATLTVNDSFEYWKTRVGLSDMKVMEQVFASPFNYAKQVSVGIPSDIPLPTEQLFQDYVSPFIRKAISVSKGRALVLFTSYSMLNRTYNDIAGELKEEGILVFKQGDDDRTRLLKMFKDDISSVLFATDSFWEGVDTPGEALELLILTRLPFSVPTDPVPMARMEAIQAKGGNPFMDYSLPEAVIKFKQGFGRLMRRSTDRGAVLILDSRVINKTYGSFFLNALPKKESFVATGDEVLAHIDEFFKRVRRKAE